MLAIFAFADCNQEVLRKYLNNRMISYLNPAADLSQFQASRSFMDGLQQASDTFRGSFRRNARGMAKAQWKDPDSPDVSANRLSIDH